MTSVVDLCLCLVFGAQNDLDPMTSYLVLQVVYQHAYINFLCSLKDVHIMTSIYDHVLFYFGDDSDLDL
jgi:hypothetical protein